MAQQRARAPLIPLDRSQQIVSAVYCAAMESQQVTESTQADMERYADDRLEVEELLRHTRARYGLA